MEKDNSNSPDVPIEAFEKAMAEANKQRKYMAAKAIQDAFSCHPDSTVVATFTGGKINVQVTPFASISDLCLVKFLIDDYIDQAIKKTVISQPITEEMSKIVPIGGDSA